MVDIPSEELLVLENQVEQFSPDMVIVFFPPNDIKDVSRETTSELLRPFYNISGDELKLDTSFVKTRKFRNRHGFTQYSVLLFLLRKGITIIN